VTLKTCFRRLPRIYDGARAATGFHVQAPRPVAGLAAHVDRLFWNFAALCAGLTDDNLFSLQSRVGGCAEIAHDLFVTGRTFLRTHELRARDAGWSKNCSVRRTAGKQNQRESYSSSSPPQQTFALTDDPSSWSRTPHEWRVCAEIKKNYYAFFQVFFRGGIGSLPMPAIHTLGSTVLRRRFPGESLKHAIEL
jgi:hypothetical protein